MKFYSNYKILHSRKCRRKCHLQIVGHTCLVFIMLAVVNPLPLLIVTVLGHSLKISQCDHSNQGCLSLEATHHQCSLDTVRTGGKSGKGVSRALFRLKNRIFRFRECHYNYEMVSPLVQMMACFDWKICFMYRECHYKYETVSHLFQIMACRRKGDKPLPETSVMRPSYRYIGNYCSSKTFCSEMNR